MSSDTELARELRIDEAIEVVAASPRILTGMSFAFVILIANLGPYALWGWAGLPALIICVMIYLAMSSYFRLRHRDRPKDISKRRMLSFLTFSVVMGTGWGSMLSILLVPADSEARTVTMLLAFIGTFATTNINSTRVAMGFGFTTLGILWLTVLWHNILPPVGASVMFVLAYLTITYFAYQAQQVRVAKVKKSMANTAALKAQLKAEEALNAARIEAARRENGRQVEIAATQRNLINAIPFPLILARNNIALEVTPAARGRFGIADDLDLATIELADFFANPQTPVQMLEQIKTGKYLTDFETQMKDVNGQTFWVTISTRSLIYDGQKAWLVAIYVIDARKKMEQELGTARDQAVTALAELHNAQKQLVHSEKMAGLGQLTAGIAHEIKNPLNFVNNFARLSGEMMDELVEIITESATFADEDAREDAQDILGTVRENLSKIDQHGMRADSIVKNMLSHSREGSGQYEEVSLNSMVKEALNLSYHGARAADASLTIDIQTDWSDEVGIVSVIPQQLQRVFLNLISNAIYAAAKNTRESGAPGRLLVKTRAESDTYIVTVTDSGAGIPAEIQHKVFEPFFTTKPTGEGTGLGLSMSFDIIKAHEGRIELETGSKDGTSFHVRLPKPQLQRA